MSPYKKYAKNVELASIVNIISTLTGLILLPILTKSLGAELYGIYALILVTISLFAPFCTLGLGNAIIRLLGPERDKGKISKDFSSIFVITSLNALAASLLLFVFSKSLAIIVFGGINATYYIQISASLIFLATIDHIFIHYFLAFQQMKRYAALMILQAIGGVVLISYLVLSGFGLFGVIISLLIIRAFTSAIGFFWITSEIKISTPSFSVLKPYLVFSLPILPAGLCYWFINLGDRYVIGYFMSADAVGVYAASYGLGCMITFFYAPISIALLPAITNLYNNNKIQELKAHLKYSLKFLLMFTIPSFFGLSVLSKSVLRTLTTSEFIGGYLVVSIIALAMVLYHCGAININVLFLLKKTKTIGLIYGAFASINLLMNIILVPLMGIIGAAIATLITFMAQLFVATMISFKRLPFDIDFKFIIKSIISSVIMAFVVWKLNPIGAVNILISIVIATGVYFVVLILLRGFTREEYLFLKGFLKI